MRTRMTIVGIVLAAVVAALGVVALLMLALGPWAGLGAGVLGAAAVLVAYRLVAQPWQHRWGRPTRRWPRPCPGTS